MAYDKNKPPQLIAQAVGSEGGSLWRFLTADDEVAVAVTGHISDAYELGIRDLDVVLHVNSTDRESNWFTALLQAHGSANGARVSTAGAAVAATSIPVAAAGTGAIIVGDIVQFDNGDDTKYRVTTGVADIAAGGTMVITPGLVKAIPDGVTTPITIRDDVIKLTLQPDETA